MKPFIVFALWAIVGWDVGAWAEAFVGIPAVVGIVAGVVIGAAFAVEARRRIVAAAAHVPHPLPSALSFETAHMLDGAA